MTQFTSIPIDIVGSSYQSRSLSISAQTTKNLYPEITPTGKVIKALHTWLGSSAWASSLSSVPRGMYVMNDVLYQVSGTTLYSVDINGVRTTIGTITGFNPVVMTDDGVNLIITTGLTGYIYDSSSDALSEITDTDFEPANSCAFLRTTIIYDGNGGRFQVSDVGDADSISGLNYATAEGSPDDTIRVYTKDQLAYIFGTRSFEIWYYSGVGSPPVDQIQSAVRNIGVASPYAVTETNETVYFMGHDNLAYRIVGYREENITSPGIARIFRDFDMSDAISYTANIDGSEFVCFKFKKEGRTFSYAEKADNWFELTEGVQEKGYFGNSFAECYGYRLIEDSRNGAIHILNPDKFDNIGEVMIRERTSSPVTGDAMKIPGQRLLMDRVRFVVEKGVGIAAGQGSIPQIAVSLSFDGGNSWTNESFINIHETGERIVPVDFYYSFEFYECMVKVRMSDPVFLSLHNASIDLAAVGGY